MSDTTQNSARADNSAMADEEQAHLNALIDTTTSIAMSDGGLCQYEALLRQQKKIVDYVNSLLAERDAEIARLTAELNTLRPAVGRYYTLTDAARAVLESES